MKNDTDLRPCDLRHGIACFHEKSCGLITCIELEDHFSPAPWGIKCKFRYCKNGGDENGEADSSMETLEGMEETEQLQQARSDSDISENQEERLVREFCGEVREQKMREELSIEWKDLRKRLGNLISRIDGQIASLSAEEKRMEERRDESYWKGVQDLYEAVKPVVAAIEDDGMAPNDIKKYFGTRRIVEAVCKTDPRTIIERVNEWKADKEHIQKEAEEFHVGDEVELESGCIGEPRKGIVTGVIDANILNLVYRLCDDGSLYSCCVAAERYKKTGRHFDSLPFMYGYEGK